MKKLASHLIILTSLSILFFSCGPASLKEKDLSEYGLPITISIPEDAQIENTRVNPKEPGQVTPFEVKIKNENDFSLYVVRYPVKQKRNLKEILSDDFTFENQYALKHKNSFKILEQTNSGYIYKTNDEIDFYSYLLKDGYLTVITSGEEKKKRTLEEIKELFTEAQKAN